MIIPYEFYTTPDGDVKKVRDDETSLLAETDREFIEEFIRRLQEFYPEAYEALCSEYAKSKLNKSYHDFLLVRRFVKCNFGEFDKKLDITETGSFQFEFVKCPLRGECKYEDCICAPKFNYTLRPRELDVMRLVYDRQSVEEIASNLYISIDTQPAERYAVRKEVIELLNSGMLMVRVIEEISVKYCCSFEKIRGIVYNYTSDNAEFVAAFKQFRSNEKRATK